MNATTLSIESEKRERKTEQIEQYPRKVIVISGTLQLITLTHLGNGESDDATDMKLQTDSADGETPVLRGTTLTGALRAYLRQLECGYGEPAQPNDFSVEIFGDDRNLKREDSSGNPSRLIVEDAFGEDALKKGFKRERRDGVRIDSLSGTAADSAKFNLESWAAGTTFPLHIELSIYPEDDDNKESALKGALCAALGGLNKNLGCITFGTRKKRGLGRAQVNDWKIREYDLSTGEGLRNWLFADKYQDKDKTEIKQGFKEGVTPFTTDNRQYFDVCAHLHPLDSLLVGVVNNDDNSPDKVHLQTRHKDGEMKPVLPGTSVAGVLRHRAETIVRTLIPPPKDDEEIDRAQDCINGIFGMMDTSKKAGSRLEVQEQLIENGETDLIQSRVSIDSFMAGARASRLFNAQPVFEKPESTVKVAIRLRNPKDYEIGLLLHVLKDVWNADVAFGGEGSIGRGRFAGQRACLQLRQQEKTDQWCLIADENGCLSVNKVRSKDEPESTEDALSEASAVAELEHYATAFRDWAWPKG